MALSLDCYSPILRDIPDFVTQDDQRIEPEARIRYFEALIEKHGQHPYLLGKLALCVNGVGANGSALALLREAQAQISARDILDPEFDAMLDELEYRLEQDACESAQVSISGTLEFSQTWKPSKQHKFPQHIRSPVGQDEIKDTWRTKFTSRSPHHQRYLTSLAIETNHIERVFRLTVESTEDLLLKGIAHGTVKTLPNSAIHDKALIKRILNDLLAAYELVIPLAQNPSAITAEAICNIHIRLLDTARFAPGGYVPPGHTRGVTMKTVFISSNCGHIQCCPYFAVEAELDKICELTRNILQTSHGNPFAFASWIHLVLGRCHPFNDGNGRTTRLIASIPLIRHGYPPMSIPYASRESYMSALSEAASGDHTAVIECTAEGMKATMDQVLAVSQRDE